MVPADPQRAEVEVLQTEGQPALMSPSSPATVFFAVHDLILPRSARRKNERHRAERLATAGVQHRLL